MFGRASTGRNRLTPQLRTPRKNQFHVVATPAARFAFQKRVARIDWRTLQSIDVDEVIRDVDIGALESVLDTVAFGDIQGEDTRNFTEANFVKIFRLAQLLVEYLLHVQNSLADHKSGLLQSKASMEQKNENIRSRFLCQRDALLQTRYELKQTKKTLRTYEVMLKENNQSNKRQVFHCNLCAKAFESSYFLDMHVARKHQNKQDEMMAPIAEEAHVKAEKSAESQQLREQYQEELQRAETNSKTQFCRFEVCKRICGKATANCRKLKLDLRISKRRLILLHRKMPSMLWRSRQRNDAIQIGRGYMNWKVSIMGWSIKWRLLVRRILNYSRS